MASRSVCSLPHAGVGGSCPCACCCNYDRLRCCYVRRQSHHAAASSALCCTVLDIWSLTWCETVMMTRCAHVMQCARVGHQACAAARLRHLKTSQLHFVCCCTRPLLLVRLPFARLAGQRCTHQCPPPHTPKRISVCTELTLSVCCWVHSWSSLAVIPAIMRDATFALLMCCSVFCRAISRAELGSCTGWTHRFA